MSKPLLSGDVRFILICILICASSLAIGISYFHRAFPEASIDFQVDRLSSQPIAEAFLKSQAIETAGYIHASSFQYDNQSKVFIERELGLMKANDLMKNQVKLWRWGHRWFKPKQKEEIRAEISTSGQMASFIHMLPEDAPGADLSPEAARSLAESFLVLVMKLPIDSLEYVDVETEKQANRTDHVLRWMVPGIDLKQGSYRISVTVQGDTIGGYSEFVKIPEEWSRNYVRLRSLNETTAQFDLIFMVLLGVGIMVVFLRRLQTKDVRWKTALVFALICLILQFLSSLNEFPAAKYQFDTASTYGGFLSRLVLSSFLNALAYAAIILLLTAGTEPVYRQACPKHLSIPRMFSWQAIRTRSFFIGSLAGITLTFFFFAFEIGFYLLANALGAWAPAEVPYSDLLNTKFPWIFVMLGGFFPAVSEEWMFRGFSIPFLQKLLRRRWIALLLASFIWGFGHANYPNQPFFIRGIEVGIVGLILSWAMFRFGILAPLIAHYSIDAFYAAFLLLRSGNLYLVTSGAITAGINLLPFLIAAGAYLFTHRFSDESAVSNETEGILRSLPAVSRSEEITQIPASQPLSRGKKAWAVSLLSIGILSLLFHAPPPADEVRFRITASQAVQSAKAFLLGMGFNLEGYRAVAQPQNRVDSVASQYIYSQKGIPGLNSFYSAKIAPLAWQTRFYKPLAAEEYQVSLDPAHGGVAAFHHYLSENDSGATLPLRKAEGIASSFVSDTAGFDLAQFNLIETASVNGPYRRDSAFVWEANAETPAAIGQARLRLQASVYGSKIGNWDQSVKISEEWKREWESKSILSTVLLGIRTVFIISIIAFAVFVLVRGTRRGLIRWKIAGGIATVVLLLELLNALNGIPAIMFQYETQVSMRIYLITSVAQEMLLLIGIGLAAALASALVMACFPDALMTMKKQARFTLGSDSTLCGAATLGAYLVLQCLVSQMQHRAYGLMTAPAFPIPAGIGNYIPFISNLRNVILSALFFSAVVAFAAYLWRQLAGRMLWRITLVAGILLSLVPASARSLSAMIVDGIPSILLVAIVCFLVAVFLRNNYLAYPVCAAAVSLAQMSLSILNRGNAALLIQGGLMWALLLAGLAALAYRPRVVK
jgi:membrane protease YdiL (CAAX protease family)